LDIELYPNTLPTLALRTPFSDELWVQANTGTSINANVRNITVTSNVALGNVTINVANHVIRFSGSYTAGFNDNVKYTRIQSNTANYYYWLEATSITDVYSIAPNSNAIVFEVNSDSRTSIQVDYTLDIQYTANVSNDIITVGRVVTQNIYSAYTYLRSIYV
jgi:hypothetical protein